MLRHSRSHQYHRQHTLEHDSHPEGTSEGRQLALTERLPRHITNFVGRVVTGMGFDQEAHQRTRTMEHKDSVYTYMILMPPVTRKLKGHCCAPEVALVFTLFLFVIITQLSLTLIAGSNIREQFASYQETLVKGDDGVQAWAIHNTMSVNGMVKTLTEAGKATQEVVGDVGENLKNYTEQIGNTASGVKSQAEETTRQLRGTFGGDPAPKRRRFAAGPKNEQRDHGIARHSKAQAAERTAAGATDGPCCAGPECAGQGLRCCRRRDSLNAVPHFADDTDDAAESSQDPSLLAVSYFLQLLGRKPSGGKGKKSNDGPSGQRQDTVCTKYSSGELSCAPPTANLLDSWTQLDTDGDGRWTIEEAKADTWNFGCLLGMPLEDVFRSACTGIIRDARESREVLRKAPIVPYPVQHRRAIPKDYFMWWKGIVGLCIHTDTALCSSMVARGMFDGAMNMSMMDIDTAMGYCHRLLRPRGVCDSSLPGSYVMHRSRIAGKCGNVVFTAGPSYPNPIDPLDSLQTMTISYSNRDMYRHTHHPRFQFFLFLVLVLWYISIVDEVKDILLLWDFLGNFPVENEVPLPPEMSRSLRRFKDTSSEFLQRQLRLSRASPQEPMPTIFSVRSGQTQTQTQPRSIDREDTRRSYEQRIAELQIENVDRVHQLTLLMTAIVRTILVIYLAIVGTVFLVTNRNYMDLLLNSLALAFIFDIDEFLYLYLVPSDTKQDLDAVVPFEYTSCFPTRGCASLLISKWVWAFSVIPCVALYYVVVNDQSTTVPVLEALDCACLKIGEHCAEAALIEKQDWWDQFWSHLAKLPHQ